MIITDVDMEAGRNTEKELQVIGGNMIEMMILIYRIYMVRTR